MKIVVTGPAAAFDQEQEQITDPGALQKLNGLEDAEAVCAEHLEGPLADLGVEGGTLRLVFGPQEGLRVVTEYQSPRKLTRSELSELVEHTTGQWSDGVGESCFLAHTDATGVSISVYPIPYDDDAVRVEQIDDGAKAKKASPLFAIIRKGDLKKLAASLDSGADIEAQGKWGHTPLMFAISNQQPEAAELLIARGANVNHQTSEKTTAIQLAAMWSNMRLLTALIAAGANVNVRDERGASPLMWAANRGPLEAVKLLIERGADVKAQDDSGETALGYAKQDPPNILELLRAHA